jgi:hypothetical protein
MSEPRCPKCEAAMQTGFIVDKGLPHGSVSTPEWAEGTPEPSFWSGVKLRGVVVHPVVTYRCTRCGYLESYAPAT